MASSLLVALCIGVTSCSVDSLLQTGTGTGGVGPTVDIQTTFPQRAGLTDSLYVMVTARASASVGALSLVGMTVRQGQTQIVGSADVGGQSAATRTLAFSVGGLTPDAQGTISFEVYAWAIDQAGHCTLLGADSAAVSCSVVDGEPVITGIPGISATLQVIAARMQKIASSASEIGDLVVDAARRVVYVTNKTTNSVDVVSWGGPALQRTASIPVGSLPWGMTLDRTGDTLIVANSGGTSLSYVDVAGGREAKRYETPNAVLYQLTPQDSTTVLLEHTDLSDRPQYVAEDKYGFVLYSTEPTQAAPDGSIRWVEQDPSWSQRESNLMLWTQVVKDNAWGPGSPPEPCPDPGAEGAAPCVIAFVDSVKIYYESPFMGTELAVYDHVPGFPTRVIADTGSVWSDIKSNLVAKGSDIFWFRGEWDMSGWLTGDTTFVASSDDGASIGIAEGARDPGRAWMWNAIGPHPELENRLISDFVNIDDYVSNTSDRVTGLSVNGDGLVEATRSASSVFFFTNPLRLRGTFDNPDIVGGSGVALHPAAQFTGGDPTTDWAAVGAGTADILIVDTEHFREIGSIAIGEPSAGPLKVTPRVSEDPADVIAHVFGVTASGSVFEVAVHSGDINP